MSYIKRAATSLGVSARPSAVHREQYVAVVERICQTGIFCDMKTGSPDALLSADYQWGLQSANFHLRASTRPEDAVDFKKRRHYYVVLGYAMVIPVPGSVTARLRFTQAVAEITGRMPLN